MHALPLSTFYRCCCVTHVCETKATCFSQRCLVNNVTHNPTCYAVISSLFAISSCLDSLYLTQCRALITQWPCVCLCLCRRFPLASGGYLDAGWWWPPGASLPCSTPWSPGLPTHHTTRGWHHRRHTLLSQAGLHGESSQILTTETFKGKNWLEWSYSLLENCTRGSLFFFSPTWSPRGFLSTGVFDHLIVNSWKWISRSWILSWRPGPKLTEIISLKALRFRTNKKKTLHGRHGHKSCKTRYITSIPTIH